MEAKMHNILLIVIIILLIGGGMWLFFQQKEINQFKKQASNTASPSQSQEALGGTAVSNSAPSVSDQEKMKDKYDEAAIGKNFVNGTVTTVQKDTLSLDVTSLKTGKKIGAYTVQITADTKVSKMEFSNPPKTTDIKLSDLKPGDMVTAFAKELLNGKTEFEAFSIQLLPPVAK